jgi:hypothetical protein
MPSAVDAREIEKITFEIALFYLYCGGGFLQISSITSFLIPDFS